MAVTDDEFIAAWSANGCSPTLVARALGMSDRGVYNRRKNLAANGVYLGTVAHGNAPAQYVRTHSRIPQRLEGGLKDGVVIAFSDAHYWPKQITVAHRALVSLIHELRPSIVVANGDMLDGAKISRHPRIRWAQAPEVKDEFGESKERMGEVEDAAGIDCRLVWNLGNHDSRFESVLANRIPEMEGMAGMTLAEHFPRWQIQMSFMLNPDSKGATMFKHRKAGGVHAVYNNVVKSGVNMVTSHLHDLLIRPWGDYNGRRFGVDTGTLADIDGPQFEYAEDDSSPKGSGFAVLTYEDGRLLPPELCEVIEGRPYFRSRAVPI